MARFHGKDGVVSADGNPVLEVEEFTMDEERGLSRAAIMGQAYVGHAVGHPARTGTIRGKLDPTDTTGQGKLTDGSTVALKLQPQGVGSGLPDWDFAAVVISSVSRGVPGEDYAGVEFQWAADSQLVESTQT